MRLLIYELRPPVLEEAGLVAALQARLRENGLRNGEKILLHLDRQSACTTAAVRARRPGTDFANPTRGAIDDAR